MPPALSEISRRFDRPRLSMRASLVRTVLRLWRGLSDHRDASIGPWLADVVPLVRQGQREEAAFTVGLMREVSLLRTGKPAPVIDLSTVRGRVNDVPLETVYTRPFIEVRQALGRGTPYPAAVESVTDRLARAVEADLQLASRSAAHASIEADERIIGYKRVLSDRPNHCPLCVVAATNTYKREDLMPIHPGCGCSVDPVYADVNGSGSLNDQVSNAYKRALEAGTITVVDHGEYGPYLQAA